MITAEDVYIEFRRAQAQFKNRGYRIPKDFEKHLKTKMSDKNREALEMATKFFNTKWKNINIFKYMECGFNVYKTFTYTRFFDIKIMNLYKQRDKNLKREMVICKKSLRDSLLFVIQYIRDNKIESVSRYCMMKNGYVNIVIEHYLNNYVDKYFIVWLIKQKMLKLDDENLALVPYISELYRELLVKLDEVKDFTNKLKELI
jgi:hypothetical protein